LLYGYKGTNTDALPDAGKGKKMRKRDEVGGGWGAFAGGEEESGATENAGVERPRGKKNVWYSLLKKKSVWYFISA
jgi:hypothetical protein